MKSLHNPSNIQRCINETPYWLQAAGVPGFSVALIERGRNSAVHCFGSTQSVGGMPVTEANIFQAASLSKQALLYAVLQTIAAGKLDLDRPLTRYMETPLSEPEADLEHITARHVLTHTTGWPNWPDKDTPLKPVRPLGQWGYSGMGFVYLQQALESIWREPALQLTRRLVLDPLGMGTSSFIWQDVYEKTAVLGHDHSGDPLEAQHPDAVNGASSLLTTAREFALLLEAYLTPAMQEQHPGVYTSQVAIDIRLGWSLGWGTAGEVLWQWGHNDGFKAFAALAPKRELGVVTLTNGACGQRINREWVNAWLEIDLPAFYFKMVSL